MDAWTPPPGSAPSLAANSGKVGRAGCGRAASSITSRSHGSGIRRRPRPGGQRQRRPGQGVAAGLVTRVARLSAPCTDRAPCRSGRNDRTRRPLRLQSPQSSEPTYGRDEASRATSCGRCYESSWADSTRLHRTGRRDVVVLPAVPTLQVEATAFGAVNPLPSVEAEITTQSLQRRSPSVVRFAQLASA